MLARYGIPAKIASIIYQFHDGMRMLVRLDDGETPEWLTVTRAFAEAVSLLPCLQSIFFTTVMTVTFDCISMD